MQFWIIIGILFLNNVSIARVPLNNHKGNGIVYREILDDKSYLKSLRQEDISFLFHEAGQIRRYGNSGLKMNFKNSIQMRIIGQNFIHFRITLR